MFGFLGGFSQNKQRMDSGFGSGKRLSHFHTEQLGFGQTRTTFKRIEESATHTPTILVSLEDIYRMPLRSEKKAGAEPVLLLKKGHTLDSRELPRLIKNGAKPSQFQIKEPGEASTFQRNHSDASNETSETATNPLLIGPTGALRMIRGRKRVLILEPNQKSLKRLIDCLFICGFNLDNIHPVRVPGHLSWAINKHKPHILIIDYQLPNFQDAGIQLTEELSAEQLIITVPPDLSEVEAMHLRKLSAEKGIKILPKPVNRFTLRALLDEKTNETGS